MSTAFTLMVVSVLSGFAAGFYTNNYLNEIEKEKAGTVVEYVTDNSFAMKRLEIEDALVRGFEKEQKLIVMKADLTEDITIDESFIDWEIFKKMQKVTVKATGKFTTNLEHISLDDIFINEETRHILLKILPPEIDSVTINEDETVFHSVERGMLRFGEIRLTTAEQNEIYKKAKQAMIPKLETDMMVQAEECAKSSVSDLAIKFLSAAGIENYEVAVILKPASS